MSNYGENICDAISTIVKKTVETAAYDRTLTCSVVDIIDKVNGKYKLKYQDSTFYAYSSNINDYYPIGTNVFVLVPDNDMTKDKIILGSIVKNIPIEDSYEDKYNYYGDNCIISNRGFYKRSSYDSTYKKELYVDIDTNAVKNSLNNSSMFYLGAEFNTVLKEEQKTRGTYGLIVTIKFKNDLDDGYVYKDFILDVAETSNNIYNKHWDRVSKFFIADGTHIEEITSVYFFVKDFPNVKEFFENDYDLYVRNIQLYAAEESTSQYFLDLSFKGGTSFTEEETSLPVDAYFKLKNNVLNPIKNNIKFLWFRENNFIDRSSSSFNEYGGSGWELIGQSANNSFSILKRDCRLKENVFKCIAIYENNKYEKVFIMKNNNASYSIEIKSDKPTEASFSQLITNLTCEVKEGETPAPADLFTYKWGYKDNTGYLNLLNITTNKVTDVVVNNINNHFEYICSVYKDDIYLGSASIKLNFIDKENAYSLAIYNGGITYKYNEFGNSPAASYLPNPIHISPITFSIFNEEGEELPAAQIIDECEIEWCIPTIDTMIKDNYTGEIVREVDSYRYISGVPELQYSIADTFNYNKTDNTIELRVRYKNVSLFAMTSLQFLKDGNQGTNGSEYYCRIVPNGNMPTDIPIFYTDIMDFNFEYISNPFNIELYRNSKRIFFGNKSNDEITIEWSMLKNTYKKDVSDCSNFTINATSGIIRYENLKAGQNAPSNIIKCTVNYNVDGNVNTLYAAMPIAVASNQNLSIKKGTGFKSILYSADGKNPTYNDSQIEIIRPSGATISAYNVVGNYYDFIKEKYINSNQLSLDYNLMASPEKITLYPADSYNGLCVNNAIVCNTSIGSMHIPIYFSLNRYGLSELNAWDGNSISLGEDGGYILSPKIGAGRKNSENLFTGVLMGEVQFPEKKSSQVGLFGFNNGEKSFFIDSEGEESSICGWQIKKVSLDSVDNNTHLYADDSVLEGNKCVRIKIGDNFTIYSDGEVHASKLKIGTTDITTGEGEKILTIPADSIQGNLEISQIKDNKDGKLQLTQIYGTVDGKIQEDQIEDVFVKKEDLIDEIYQGAVDAGYEGTAHQFGEDLYNLLKGTDESPEVTD